MQNQVKTRAKIDKCNETFLEIVVKLLKFSQKITKMFQFISKVCFYPKKP